MIGVSADVAQIRSRYLSYAVMRVIELAAQSGFAARKAACEIQSYCEWVRDGLPPGDQRQILKQIQPFLSNTELENA